MYIYRPEGKPALYNGGKCVKGNVVYQGAVTRQDTGQTDFYTGVSESSWKLRYNNPDLEKTSSMNSAEFSFLKDFRQICSFFRQIWILERAN